MFKKIIITFFVLIFSLFSQALVFADSIPVENIFSDINKDYKYLNELQELYDKGMILPDENGKFNPNALLNRDEFVGIMMEVTCKDCIQPNTSLDFLSKYENSKLFFDISKTNKYYYCIADANEQGFVNGYQEGTVCEDGSISTTEKPFCPNNTIILEEAIAIILRASGILTNVEADKIRQEIYSGKITEKLSDDVSPKNLDGSVYSFYPDFMRALDYEIIDVDKDGNTKIYNLVEVIDGKIRPKKAISKEEFLKIAYVTLKANSCEDKKDFGLSLNLNIYDKSCNSTKTNCELSNLADSNNIYDFGANTITSCNEGIKEPEGYIWRFYNNSTGEEIKKYGKYIDNYSFLSSGKWTVFSRVIDKCGNTGEVYNTINIGSDILSDIDNDLSVSIIANPIFGKGPMLVDFESIIGGGKGPFTYYWDFGDGNNSLGNKAQNIFKEQGVYEVTVYVKDSLGNIGKSSVLIELNGISDTNIDSDGDNVNDSDDLCPLLKGDIKNNGCPILEKSCNTDSNCSVSEYCSSDTKVCLPKKISSSCEYNGGDIIFGNAVCNSCPCNNSLDFISTLRKCDILFPAITSPDSKSIYSKGELFQIK